MRRDLIYHPTKASSFCLIKLGVRLSACLSACLFALALWAPSLDASPAPDSSKPSTSGAEATREVIIFHTSDIHGYIKPHPARWNKEDPKRLIGGFEALAALIAEEETSSLLLDSGDFFQGAPEGTLSRGGAIIRLMNALNYDASVVGNHEYDFGEENLIKLSQSAKFPLLAANIQRVKDGTPAPYVQPWALFERGGVKIGVIGLSTRFTSTATLPTHVSHLRFVQEVQAARPHVQALRHAGADVVIALTHCGVGPSVARKRIITSEYHPPAQDLKYPGDILIAKEAGVDLVLGGHAHAAFSELWRPEGGAPIAQSGEHLEGATRISIRVTPGQPLEIKGALIPLWADALRPHPATGALVKEISSEVEKQMNIPLGQAADPLPRFAAPPALDGPLPNLFCDEMAEVAHADVALHNTFGLRNDLNAGPLTVGHLYQVMPFENTLAVMSLTGEQLKSLLLQNLKGGVSRLQVSHHLTLTTQRAPDGAFINGEVRYLGQPIDDHKVFKVAMNSYMASGGSCCQVLVTRPHTDTAISLRILFMDVIKKKSPVKAPQVGRIRIVD